MKTLLHQLSFAILILTAFVVVSNAQDTSQQNSPPAAPDARGNAVRQLGLTPEQMKQVRQINQSRKPQMEAAQARLRDANKALNESIYSDHLDDAVFQARLKDFASAQAEVASIRFASELAIRKVLTPEQLTRFREMRQRFEASREDRRTLVPGVRRARPIPLRQGRVQPAAVPAAKPKPM